MFIEITKLWNYLLADKNHTRLSHVVHSNTLFLSHKSQYRKDDKSSNNTGSTVQQTEPEAVPKGQIDKHIND